MLYRPVLITASVLAPYVLAAMHGCFINKWNRHLIVLVSLAFD